MSRSALTWTIVCIATAVAGAAGIVTWHVRARQASYVTDADAIRVPAGSAATRDVRWRPALHESPLGSGLDDRDPVLSPDGSTVFFARGRAGDDADLFMAQRRGGTWSAPQALAAVNTRADELGPALAPDGGSLYFASNRPGGVGLYDLWVTRRDPDGQWTAPENLGPRVNSRYNDHAPAPSPDGRLLLLASNRPGPDDAAAPGPDAWPSEVHAYSRTLDDDLYVVDLAAPAAAPVAMSGLNGPFDDTAPAVSPVGDFIYFASDRPGGAGGFDLLRSRIVRGAAQPPERLGEGVNTAASELDPSVGLGGFGLHFASDRVAEREPAPAPAPAAGAAPVGNWEIYSTTSREVFTEIESWRAALDAAAIWRALWPYLLALSLMALVVAGLLRALRSIHHRGLSLIVRAMIGSLVVHMALLVGFAFWSVSTSSRAWRRPGSGVQVVLYTPAATTGIAGQVRGRFTEIESPGSAPAVGRSAPEVPTRPGADLSPAFVVERVQMMATEPPAVTADARDAPAPAPPDRPPVDSEAPPPLEAVALDLPAPGAPPERAAEAPATPASGPVAIAATRSAAGFDQDAAHHARDAAITMAPEGVVMRTDDASLADPGMHDAQADRTPMTADSAPGGLGSITAPAHLPALVLPGLPEGERVAAVPSPDRPAGRVGALSSAAAEAAVMPMAAPAAMPSLEPARRAAAAAEEPIAAAAADAATAPPAAAAPAAPAAVPVPPGPLRLDLPELELVGAEAGGEVQPDMPGDLAPAMARPWLAAAPSDDAPEARLEPSEVALAPMAVAIALPDPPQPALPEPLLALDLPRPETAFEPIDLDLPLPRRSIAVPLQQRAQENRQEILEKMGGDVHTEEAVARALDWLARHQSADGHWDCTEYDDHCGACRGMGQARADIALTGLALMCFLAADHTPERSGPHRDRVERALDWLVHQQKPGGNLMGGDIESMYSHGIATTALAEAYGMTGDERYELPVKRAVEFIHRSQALRGGRRYTPGQAGDTSVTGWQIMALSAARQVNVAVPDSAFDVGALWMERVADPDRPGIFAYQPSYEPSEAMTAEGMFVRQLLGVPRSESAMRASARHLVTHRPAPDGPPNSYYWYYATLALFQYQGEEWRDWNKSLKPMLLASQVTEGRAAGSWDIPVGDRWANVGGRVYQTAICTLTLEVYYRYLPRFLQEPVAGSPR